MSFPFMDMDEYRRLYPEYCTRSQTEDASPETEYVFDTARTPAQVVQEFSVKSTQKHIGNAYFEELEEYNETNATTTFICNARMLKFHGSGRSRTKKIAKQIACFELLKCAVEMDRYKDFNIPAKTKEEALNIVEKMRPVDDVTDVENQVPAQPENWIGKLTEFCAQNKLPSADYEFTEEGPPNMRTFTAYATVGASKGFATGKKKKEAKSAAAKSLLMILEPQVASLQKVTDQMEGKGGDMGTEEDVYEPLEGILSAPGVNVSRAQTEPEPQAALELILKDTARFLTYNIQYRELEQPSSRGRTQTLLTVQYSKAPPQPLVHADGTITTPKVDKDAPAAHNYVFCGEGTDVQSGRDEAARAALVHFLTYKGTREITPAPTPTPTVTPNSNEQ